MSAGLLTLEADAGSFEARWSALRDALDDELERAVKRHAQTVARIAKATHRFENRTGVLEASIRADETTTGRATAGGQLAGRVRASAPYASYVDGRRAYAFMAPAAELAEPYFEAAGRDALDRAVRRAGLPRA